MMTKAHERQDAAAVLAYVKGMWSALLRSGISQKTKFYGKLVVIC